MLLQEADPKGLVRESYRIDGITLGECRSIFVDWALSLPVDAPIKDAVREKRAGRTGNTVLARSRQRMGLMGIDGTIYSHPIGKHGHGAGPLVGLWDYQDGVPGRGDHKVIPGMWYSIELQATTPVPEWGNQPVRFALEEDAAIMPGGKWDWIDGRQEAFYLIKP